MPNSPYKGILMDYDVISTYDDTQYDCYQLTPRQVAILLTQSSYVAWKTRWSNLPGGTDLLNIRDAINAQLMNPGDCGDMPIDCNEVENCLITSPTIAQIVADIANLQNVDIGLQSQITSNDGDIDDLQDVDVVLQSQITQNAGDIINLQNVDLNLQSQISVNAGNIITNTNAIQSNDSDINDHENRITALENSGGGGGGDYQTDIIVTKRLVGVQAWIADTNGQTVDIPQGYRKVILEFEVNSTSGVGGLFVYANGDTTNTHYRRRAIGQTQDNTGAILGNINPYTNQDLGGGGVLRMELYYPHLQSPTVAITSYAQSDGEGNYDLIRSAYGWTYLESDAITQLVISTNAGMIKAGSTCMIFVEEEKEVLVPVTVQPLTPKVTYDPGGESYQGGGSGLDGLTYSGYGVDSSNCARGYGNLADGAGIFLEKDMGQNVTFDEIDFSFYYENQDVADGGIRFEIWLDYVKVWSKLDNDSAPRDKWNVFSVWSGATIKGDDLTNATGRYLQIHVIRDNPDNVDYAEVRIDNIGWETI